MHTSGFSILAVVSLLTAGVPSRADVVATPSQAKLLAGADPKLVANKRLVYDFWREVIEGGHIERAAHYLTPGYIQHNPNVPTGRDGFVAYFSRIAKPGAVADRVQAPLVDIVAEGDMVVLSFVRAQPEPGGAQATYTTTWFDMFRIDHGKIAEHWDPALKHAPAAASTAEPLQFDAKALKEYAGRYPAPMPGVPADFTIVLAVQGNHLALDAVGTGIKTSGAELLVEKVSEDVFSLSSGGKVAFVRDANGAVVKLTLDGDGQHMTGVKAN